MVKTKIEIITPVHIGTGETKMAFEYRAINNNIVYNYKPNDLFNYLPPKELLDKKFLRNLNTITQNVSNIRTLNNTLKRYVKYNELKPNYILNSDIDDLQNDLDKKNISEQVKALDKPIIPGSTIKGAIYNAINYEIVRKNIDLIMNGLNNGYKVENVDSLLNMTTKGNKDFIKEFHGCIICRDITFDKLRLVLVKRPHVYKDNSEIPLPNCECIDYGQLNIDDYIIIDKFKVNQLKHKYEGEFEAFKDFMMFLNYRNLSIACSNYFRAMTHEELTVEETTQFYSKNGLGNALKKLNEYKQPNSFYMRLGSNTNYFFKTISYLFKNKYPDYFKENFETFTPIPLKNKIHPLPETLPATRTIYYDDAYDYYPGVVKIEFIDED